MTALPLSAAAAQQLNARFSGPVQEHGAGTALLIETVGGSAGSALGFTVAAAVLGECESEDIVCNLGSAAAAVTFATATAAAGAYLLGRLAETRPSGLGASLGAVIGAAAGIGAWHLATEELDVVTSDAAGIAIFAVTQGVFAALGSRVVRALKD